MPSQNYNLIKQAIEQKQQITATYNGLDREMCPHTIGTKNGREKALFYQFGGRSHRGLSRSLESPDNWRCMFIKRLTNVKVRDGDWYTAKGGHSRPQTCVGTVELEVPH